MKTPTLLEKLSEIITLVYKNCTRRTMPRGQSTKQNKIKSTLIEQAKAKTIQK
jgi:hypothetical protein